jgi:hypothetical protein
MEDQKLKKIMYVLAAVAVVLAGVLAYIWYDKYTVEKELESEKADLIGQLNTLNDDYASLSTDYEDVNLQLDSSRLEVQLLIEKLTKTEATNRAKIRQYERELGTLRTVMRGYVKQIDSLHSLNKQLTADAAEARREAAENRRRSEELSKTVEDLSGQVAAGAVIKARGLRAEAYNASNKVTDRSSRVKYLLATLNLVENDLAEKGPVTVYIRVKDPEGILLLNGTQKAFEYNGETMICSASREVDYQGSEVELGIYLNDIPEYAKGIYTVEAFTSQTFLGTTELMLR